MAMRQKNVVETYKPRVATFDLSDMEYFPTSGMPDLNMSSLRYYRDLFRLYQPNHPYSYLKDEEFLSTMGITVIEDDKTHLSKAGLLLFGQENAIHRYYPHFFLSYVDDRDPYDLGEKEKRIESYSGTWDGNLFRFLLIVTNELSSKQYLYRHVQTHNGYLVQIVREMLSIASCNADFNSGRGIYLHMGERSIELSFPVSKDFDEYQFSKGKDANPTIANALACINLAKRRGMGLAFIKKLTKQLGYAPLSLKLDPSLSEVTILVPLVKEQSMDKEHNLNEFERYLEELAPGAEFSRLDVIKATGKSKAMASIYIKKALRNGQISLDEKCIKGKYRKN